jgi:hypothetical protein
MVDIELVIKIPKDTYVHLLNGGNIGASLMIENALKNGTPLPDNATNGDVIKTIFDVTEEHFYDEDRMVDVYGLDRTDDPSTFYADWWNSPYQKGGKG